MNSGSRAFDMGRMAFGGLGQVLDSVEFVKRAWSTMNLPGTMVPTVDIDELDRRIADLKAVEQWLNVNLGMLRGTIQGLEIQRGTLAAVKAFGATLGTMPPPAPPEPPARAGSRARPAPPPEPPRAAAPERTPPPEPAAAAEQPAPAAGPPQAGAGALPGIDPSAWWNLLQANFNQVAEAALSGGGLQGVAASALKAAGDMAGSMAEAAVAAATPAAAAPAARKPAAPARPRARKSSSGGGDGDGGAPTKRAAAPKKRAATPRAPRSGA
jgi:hypothetical protein